MAAFFSLPTVSFRLKRFNFFGRYFDLLIRDDHKRQQSGQQLVAARNYVELSHYHDRDHHHGHLAN